MGQKPDNRAFGEAIAEGFDAIGTSVGRSGAAALERYSSELLRWNRRTNLTGAREPIQFARGPLFDALTILAVLEPGHLVDVGAGGGLPGIPALLAGAATALTLVEPRAKRATFLRHVTHALGIGARVVQGRDEDLEPGSWDGAVAQAVWPPGEWIPRGSRLVRPGGAVYVLSSDRPANAGGAKIEALVQISRPADGARRFACRLRKDLA